jgi:hypothetical protein
VTLTRAQIDAWRKIVDAHDGARGDIHMPRSLLGELLDMIPEYCAVSDETLSEDDYDVTFERREGRLPYTVGRSVLACEIRGPWGGLVAGSEITTTDALDTYPELVAVYRRMALNVAVSTIKVQS